MDARKINDSLFPYILPTYSEERYRIRMQRNEVGKDWLNYLAIRKLHIAFGGMFSRVKK
jgi:hypothetical protein